MTVRDVLGNSEIPRRDAEFLLLHCVGQADRGWLIAHNLDEVPIQALDDFKAACQQRARGLPLAYIVGRREFWSLSLAVTPDVLIPRPETELLVEWVLEHIGPEDGKSMLDLGTGSGAIALACKHDAPSLTVTACDISARALAVANKNALDLSLSIEFLQSDWFSAMGDRRWSLIVANPPYVAHVDPHLSQGDLRFEPQGALTDGSDGLGAIRRIIEESPEYLERGGWLFIEHGYDQAKAVNTLFKARGFADVSLRRDLAGRPRASGGCWQ